MLTIFSLLPFTRQFDTHIQYAGRSAAGPNRTITVIIVYGSFHVVPHVFHTTTTTGTFSVIVSDPFAVSMYGI